MVQRIYHEKCGGQTGEGSNQGLLFHLIASFSTEESCGVPEGCCCRLRWVSRRSGFCNRSSVIEPGWGANLLLYLRFDYVTRGCYGSVLCSLPLPVFSHKMAPSPLKTAVCKTKWMPLQVFCGIALRGWLSLALLSLDIMRQGFTIYPRLSRMMSTSFFQVRQLPLLP